MASAGIRKTSTGRYKVWWRLDDGTQGAKTFDARGLARDFKNELLAQVAVDSWTDPRRGRILFDEWADHWWQLWSSSPRRSPKGMETTESHLRCHLRPYFGRRQLRQITPSIVLRWQNELEGKLSHSGVMACRSILLRILEAARRERLIPTNPVRDVEAPKPRINPERIFGHERRRTFTPEEFGRFLAACRPFYRDHFLAQVGTGLRSGELLGLRRRRVFPDLRRIEVIEVRYEAGRFGRGFKAEPKSPASVRVVPMCEKVRQAIGRQLPAGARADELVVPGPGGSNGIPRGARTPLSTHNLRRVYQAAVAAAGEDLAHLDLHGPHDLRHTFATWLEDAGIPTRVIDELMGHAGGRRHGDSSGSPMGRVYRETTPTMLARVTAALDERIGRAIAIGGNLPHDAEGWTGTEAG
jgi:integrase